MAWYRFFGSTMQLAGTTTVLTTYGQRVELNPEVADKMIRDDPSASLIPEDLWAAIFLPGADTETELAEYPAVHMHAMAPASFIAKAKAVRGSHYDYRGTLLLTAKETAAAPPALPIAPAAAAAAKPSGGTVEAEPEAKS